MSDDTARMVQEASMGGAAAIDELLTRFLPELRAFVRLRAGHRIMHRESEDDLVQSVCREVLMGVSDFEYRGLPAFKNWLYSRALHKIYDRNKFYGREKRDTAREHAIPTDPGYLSGFGSLITPSRAAIAGEEVAQLEAAFDQLPSDYCEVITLAKIVGLSHKEIGEQMGKTEGNARVLLHRALARLGMLMEG